MKKVLIFLLSFFTAYAGISQAYVKPNTSYGIIQNRSRPDSTLWTPTGNSTPSGITSLRSTNQRMGALFYDSTAKKYFGFHPTDTTWTELGASVDPNDFIHNQATYQTSARFNIMSGSLDSLKARLAAGIIFINSAGVEIARFGNGPSTTTLFSGLANYNADYSGSYTSRSLIDKGYATSTFEPIITAPNTTLKYWTGYKTWGSFNDSARAAISLTTTGTSGAATYNNGTGVFNIPQYQAAGSYLNISDTAAMLNPYPRGTGSATRIAFWDGTRSLGSNSNFNWDNSNERLGIGTASPSNQIHLIHAGGANSGVRIKSTGNSSFANLSLYNDLDSLGGVVMTGSTYAGNPRELGLYSRADSGVRISTLSNRPIKFDILDGIGEIARFRQNGLSIGTATGGPKLNILYSANTSFNTGISIGNTSSASVAYTPIELTNDAGVLSQLFLTSSAWTPNSGVRASGAGWNNGGAGGLSFVAYNAAGEITFHTNSTYDERMRIDEGGKVSIGSKADAVASAILELSDSTKGFLAPRGTTTHRNAIPTPDKGLMFFDTTIKKQYNYVDAQWKAVQYEIDTTTNWLTAGDVTMTNASQWYTGATITLGVGVWVLHGQITMSNSGAGSIAYWSRLYDGTNAFSGQSGTAASAGTRQWSANMGYLYIVSSGTKTITLEGWCGSTLGSIKATLPTTSTPGATGIIAYKIK